MKNLTITNYANKSLLTCWNTENLFYPSDVGYNVPIEIDGSGPHLKQACNRNW